MITIVLAEFIGVIVVIALLGYLYCKITGVPCQPDDRLLE